MMSIQINLPDSLTIHQIDQNYSQLLEQLDVTEQTIEINGSAVESIDTSGLQALIVLIRHAQETSNQVSWNSPSDVLKQSAEKIGVHNDLLLS